MGKVIRALMRLIVVVCIAIFILECLTRLFLMVALNKYVEEKIAEPYRKAFRQVFVFPFIANFTDFDARCYFVPKGGIIRENNAQISVPSKGHDEIRLLCLGDSTTWGACVLSERSYPSLLEEKLKKVYPGKDINVLNAGCPGSSSRQVKRIFQCYLADCGADIIIWRKGTWLTDRYETPNPAGVYLKILLWRILYESRIFRLYCTIADNHKTGRWNNPTADKFYDGIMRRYDQVLPAEGFSSDFEIVKDIAYKKGTRFVAALDFTCLGNDMNFFCDCEDYKRLNIAPLISTHDILLETITQQSWQAIFIDECHFTELGNDLIAEEVADFIVQEKWIEML